MKKSILSIMLFCTIGFSTFLSQATYSPEEMKEKQYHVRKSFRLGTIIRARKKTMKNKTLQRNKEQRNKFTAQYHYFDCDLYQ